MKEFIHKIKYYFFQRALIRVAGVKKERAMINLAAAKSIGIIFDATIVHNTTAVAEFAAQMKSKGKKIDQLGFTEEVHAIENKDSHLFNKKDLDWRLIPSKPNVDAFIAKEFDILIGAYIGHCAPLEYIAALSNAKLRVGAFQEGMEFCYDLMINIGDKEEVEYLINQIDKFLKGVKAK
ncbi:MAG: hypothetical protein KA797_04070 [Chitinophagales bacterium]|nr:hypothetical protein [Chitinophagales bacterium]